MALRGHWMIASQWSNAILMSQRPLQKSQSKLPGTKAAWVMASKGRRNQSRRDKLRGRLSMRRAPTEKAEQSSDRMQESGGKQAPHLLEDRDLRESQSVGSSGSARTRHRKPLRRITRRILAWGIPGLAVAIVAGIVLPIVLEPDSSLAFVHVQGPEQAATAAFLHQLATSPVEKGDGDRFYVEDLEPFDLGLLSAEELPHVPVRMAIANTGEEPTTIKSLTLVFYASPFKLQANYWPSEHGENWRLEAGQQLDLTVDFQFTDVLPGGRAPEPDWRGKAEEPRIEASAVLQLTLTDNKKDQRACSVQYATAAIPEEPELRKAYWWPDTWDEQTSPYADATFPLSWLEPGSNPWLAPSYQSLGDYYVGTIRAELDNAADKNEADELYQKAIDAYSTAIELDPSSESSYANRAGCLDSLGRYDDAITDYEIARDIDPQESANYWNLAFVYWRKYKEAEGSGTGKAWLEKTRRALEDAADLGLKDAETFRRLAITCYLLEDYEGTVDACTKAINLGGPAPDVYYLRAVAHWELAQLEEQSEHLQEYLDDTRKAERLGQTASSAETSPDTDFVITFPIGPFAEPSD